MEGEEEGEQCDGRAVRRAVAGAAACGDETGESPSRLSLSSTGRRAWSASCGRPQKRAGRKSFLALALVDGASSARCGELGRLGPEDVGRAEKSREKVLLGSPPLADLIGARPVAQDVVAAVGARSRSVDGWRSARARRKRERRKSPCGGQFWRGEGAEKGRPWRWCRPLAHHGFDSLSK